MSRVIDAHSGAEVVPGGVYDGTRILAIKWSVLRCWVLIEKTDGSPCYQSHFYHPAAPGMPSAPPVPAPCPVWAEIPVRFLHPYFFLQRVAFLPT